MTLLAKVVPLHTEKICKIKKTAPLSETANIISLTFLNFLCIHFITDAEIRKWTNGRHLVDIYICIYYSTDKFRCILSKTLQYPYKNPTIPLHAFSRRRSFLQNAILRNSWVLGHPQQAAKQNLYRSALLANLQMYIRLHCLPICEFISNVQRMHTIFRVCKFNFLSAYCIPYHSYHYNKSGTFGKFMVDFGVIFGVPMHINFFSKQKGRFPYFRKHPLVFVDTALYDGFYFLNQRDICR